MSSDVFPRNNLPPASAPWGRAVEDRARSNSQELTRVRTAVLGDNRATSGQMGVVGKNIDDIARQINELGARDTGTVSVPNATRSTGSSWGSASSTFEVPGDGSSRNALVSILGEANFGSAEYGFMYVQVLQGSTLVFGTPRMDSSDVVTGASSTVSGSFVFPIGPNGTTFTLRAYTMRTTGSGTMGFTGGSASFLRANRDSV